ncbi:MAG: hypothetical protein M1821_004822 [Bathelium mastoideum]|nr:MAG: hypothetical protein M1821_004822 [Bathelium mastoideum]
MASRTPDPNMFTTPFQLTQSMHRDVYPPVDPNNTDVKAAGAGKVILITGASGGLGYKVAQVWANARAAGIVLVGRNAEKLEEVADSLKVSTMVCPGNVASALEVEAIYEDAVEKFGRVDVLVNAAGGGGLDMATGTTEPDVWWKALVSASSANWTTGEIIILVLTLFQEDNVLGFYNMAHYFIQSGNGQGTVINLVSLSAAFLVHNMSSYSCAKLAAIKLTQYLSLENPDLRVFSIHPGIVQAEAGRGPVIPSFTPFAKDKQVLTAGVTLYLQKPEADYLRGGFVSVNWDVEEMAEHKDEIAQKHLLQLDFIKAELGPRRHAWGSRGEGGHQTVSEYVHDFLRYIEGWDEREESLDGD